MRKNEENPRRFRKENESSGRGRRGMTALLVICLLCVSLLNGCSLFHELDFVFV